MAIVFLTSRWHLTHKGYCDIGFSNKNTNKKADIHIEYQPFNITIPLC